MIQMAMLIRPWRLYQGMAKKYPMKTVVISTGVLMGVGDVISQVVVEKNGIRPGRRYDYLRTLRFTGFGTLVIGPMYAVWYRYLATAFTASRLSSLKMVFMDQAVFAPPFLVFFLIGIGVFKGDGPSKIKEKVEEDIEDVIWTNWQVWPAVQTLNFTFIPVYHRVLVINLVSIGWNTYLSWKSENVKKLCQIKN